MTAPLLSPLPPLPASVSARLGDPRLLFPRGLESFCIDVDRGLLLLAGDDLVVVRDLVAYEESPGGIETDAEPFHLATFVAGTLVTVDGNTLGRADPRTGEDIARAVKLVDVATAAIDANASVIAVVTRGGRLTAYDAASGTVRATCSLGSKGPGLRLHLAPGGERALVLADDVRVVDLSSGRTLWTRPRAEATGGGWLGPDRALLVERQAPTDASGPVQEPVLRVLQCGDGAVVRELALASRERETRFSVAGAPAAGLVAVGLADRVEVWRIESAERTATVPITHASALAFRDGMLQIASTFGLHLLSEDGRQRRSLDAPRRAPDDLLARGDTVWLGESAGALVWQPDRDEAKRLELSCSAGALSPDGLRFVARIPEGVVIGTVADGAVERRIPGLEDTQHLAWGGPFIVATGLDEHVRVVSADEGAVVATFPAPATTVFRVEISPDGAVAALLLYRQPPRLVALPAGTRMPPLAWPAKLLPDTLSLTRGGREVVVGTKTGELLRFDTASGALLGRVKVHAGRVESLATSSDGRLAAVGHTESGKATLVRLVDLMHPLILAAQSRPKTAWMSSCSRRHSS